jgi:hypothetical protein
MGLLDDAIREHLELKRLRGADPGEVAREQREALDPVPRDRHSGQGDRGELDADAIVMDDGGEDEEDEIVAGSLGEVNRHGGEEESVHGGDFSHVGQETAELDMRTVLGDELSAPQDDLVPAPSGHGGQEIQADVHAPEDSLEWEAPGGGASGELAEDDDARHEHSVGVEEPAEDVLEETPDFLLDTPEQDRLWFEQQPPRDFDFDK